MKNLEKSHTRTERRQNVLTGSTINSSQYGILILLNGHHEQLVKTVRGSMIFKGSLLVIDIMIYRRSLENKWSLHSLLLFPFFCPVCEAHQISPWLQTPPCFFFNTTVCVGKEHLHLDSDVCHQRALSDAAYEYRGISFFLYFFFRGYGAEACTARLTLLPPSVPLFHVLVGDEVVWRQCRYGWCDDAVSHRFVPGLKLFEGKDLSSTTAPWNNSIPSIYRWRWVSYVTWGVFTNEVFFLNPRVKSNNNHTPCHLCLMACCCILHLCHVFPWSSEIAVAQTNGALTLKSLLIQSP